MNPEHLETLFARLEAAGVRYLIVGGLAVMAHGYLRATRDLDLVLALDADNLDRALREFETLGYRPNVPVPLSDFADPEKRKYWQREKGMTVFPLVSERYRDCPIDLFVEEPFEFESMYRERVDFEISPGLSLPVVGLGHLRAMKERAGRPRDLLDLIELDGLSEGDA